VIHKRVDRVLRGDVQTSNGDGRKEAGHFVIVETLESQQGQLIIVAVVAIPSFNPLTEVELATVLWQA